VKSARFQGWRDDMNKSLVEMLSLIGAPTGIHRLE